MKKIILLALIASSQFCEAQTVVTNQNTIIDSAILYSLTNPLVSNGSTMSYTIADIPSKGAAFSINYINQGGTGFDGYPSGKVGSAKAGGTYYSGNPALCGMPVKIGDLGYNLRINWNTIQTNANDSDDKWWATINVIFDSSDASLEPNPLARDYDLVIQHVSYQQDDLLDKPNTSNGSYWYFARDLVGDIKPFTLFLNGNYYHWAVRYKFFDYPIGDPNEYQNDKVHIKFIPIDNNAPIPFFDHPLKDFINCTKDYLAFLTLTTNELVLANEKVADTALWIKQLAAGYEVYTGNSTLANDFFFVRLDSIKPDRILDLTLTTFSDSLQLNWSQSSDTAFDQYKVYRSENNGPFVIIADSVRINTYTDLTLNPNSNYKYYVSVLDRSYNESDSSNVVETTTLSTSSVGITQDIEIKCFPNPFFDILNISFPNGTDQQIEVFDILGRNLTEYVHIETVTNGITLNFEQIQGSIFIVKGKTFANIVYKQ